MIQHLVRTLLAIFAGLCFASGIQAQTPTYKIFNDSNHVLHFDTLDPSRGTWKKQRVNPHQGKQYSITSGSRSAKIRIATPKRGYVEYDIGSGGIYNLRWDNRKGMWDVKADKQADNRPQQTDNALPYSIGDAVMVLWKGKWYRATVIRQGRAQVKIHYDGYGNNWDEWVGAERIRYR